MSKNPTGRKFTPQEFRLLTPCVQCGKMDDIHQGGLCGTCEVFPIPKCEICEILLRFGEYTFFTYDNTDEHRDINFNPIKQLVREFSFIEQYIDAPIDGYCIDCVDYEYQMRNRCAREECKKLFSNTKEHYKQKGNLCDECYIQENG